MPNDAAPVLRLTTRRDVLDLVEDLRSALAEAQERFTRPRVWREVDGRRLLDICISAERADDVRSLVRELRIALRRSEYNGACRGVYRPGFAIEVHVKAREESPPEKEAI